LGKTPAEIVASFLSTIDNFSGSVEQLEDILRFLSVGLQSRIEKKKQERSY
jgi:hypothetical protein